MVRVNLLNNKLEWRGKRERGRTIRFREEDLREGDALAMLYDLPFSIIIRKCLTLVLNTPALQRRLFGEAVTHCNRGAA